MKAARAKKNYLIDVKLFAAIRVDATDADAACEIVRTLLEGHSAHLGNIDGAPVIVEPSIESCEIVEVDGEAA